jgi:hypothetical protein
MTIIERLNGGEVVFLPSANWRVWQDNGGGKLYAAARERGRYLHVRRWVEEGVPGVRVWIDDEPRFLGGPGGRKAADLFATAKTLGGPSRG